MAGLGYIKDTDHAENLTRAMDDFHEALTHRWRELVTQKLTANDRAGFPRDLQPGWRAESLEELQHVKGDCEYVRWVNAGQQSPLSSVTCAGNVPGVGTGGQPIKCGMGGVLKAIDDWAYTERRQIYAKLPLFDRHDVSQLEAAYNGFLTIGGLLGLEPAAGSADTGKSFTPTDERELAGKVQDLSGARGRGQDWWAGWTGLAASRARAGFFDSVAPSLNNQSGIVGTLANLYSARAAIIEKGRNDALYWIQWATKSLRESQTITTNLVGGWKVLQAIGGGISIFGAWSIAGAAVGAGVTLVGFIGENLISSIKTEAYKYDLIEVVDQLSQKIDQLGDDIAIQEGEYGAKVAELDNTVYRIHSYNLELYDPSRSPQGDNRAGKGYTADIDNILQIAKACYDAGNLYAELLPTMARTADASPHLANRDGKPTLGDTLLLQVRGLLEQFLKTTCGRYLIAGDQVTAAAEAYAKSDPERKAAYDRIMADWKAAGIGRYDPTLDDEAGSTDRPIRQPPPDSGRRSASEDPGLPGAGDGTEYETD